MKLAAQAINPTVVVEKSWAAVFAELVKARLTALADAAAAAIPDCPGAEELRKVIRAQTAQLFPPQLAQYAA